MGSKYLKLNGIISLLNKLIALVCSLIIPRLFIVTYGSEINGLLVGITQYLSLISLLDLGMGAVIQAALYKPLVEKDSILISTVYFKAKKFFNKVGIALIIYIVALCFILPTMLNSSLSNLDLVLLILVLSTSHIFQFFLGITAQIILNSDQKAFIRESLQALFNIINLILVYYLVTKGYSVLVVKLVTMFIYIVIPIYLTYYVRKNYVISRKLIKKDYKLAQQWHGIGQHLAYTIQESSSVVILSIFSTLNSVSVYTVYFLVLNGLKTFMNAATSGLRPFLGKLLNLNNSKELIKNFRKIEKNIQLYSTIVLATTFQLITPFILLYTEGVEDANYNQPVFGYVVVITIFIYALRLPYRTIIFSAGEFKETRFGTYIETFLNIGISIILVQFYDLLGVAIGAGLSMIFSYIYYGLYTYNKILNISKKHLVKQNLLCILIFLSSNLIFLPFNFLANTVISWIIFGAVSFVSTLLISYIYQVLLKNI